MSEIFTITFRHMIALVWFVVWSIVFTVRNENDYYTYFDRVFSWFAGLVVGLIGGAFIL